MATSYRASLVALALLAACDMPSGSDCLPGRDVSDWVATEHSPESMSVPVVSCGRMVGWDVSMPAGDHPSVIWGVEKAFGGMAGERIRLSTEISSSGPAAIRLRPSLESATRVEFGFAEMNPAKAGMVSIPAQAVPTAGGYRKIGLVFPVSGAGTWRVSGVDW